MGFHGDYSNFSVSDRKELLSTVLDSYEALAAEQGNWVANLSNAASLIWHAYHSLPSQEAGYHVNWAGFYTVDPKDKDQLILGPFQGKVACQTIKLGKGVCGTAGSSKKTQLVKNVEEFPGHIACDGDTKSEIVVPIVNKKGELKGVIDLDCTELSGFGAVDVEYLEKLAAAIAETCEW